VAAALIKSFKLGAFAVLGSSKTVTCLRVGALAGPLAIGFKVKLAMLSALLATELPQDSVCTERTVKLALPLSKSLPRINTLAYCSALNVYVPLKGV
jgi:hypothetical protein